MHLVGLVLLQTSHSNRHHHRHATGYVQLHGRLAAKGVVGKQEAASRVCIDTLHGVSPGKILLPFASATRTRTEDALVMLSIVVLMAPEQSFMMREVVNRQHPVKLAFQARKRQNLGGTNYFR